MGLQRKPFDFRSQVTIESKPLRNYALKLTQDSEDADDLLQDTVLKALTNEDKFAEGTNLKGWLYTIMKNIFINKYRRAVKSNIFHDDTESQFHLNNAPGPRKNQGESRLVMEDIQKAMGEISDNLRTPFMMSYTGYKYEEIARHLKLPLGTVKVRIHNARKALSSKLEVYRDYSE